MKVVINNCFGGFGLSEAAMRAYYGRKGVRVFSEGGSFFTLYFDEPMPPQFVLPDGQLFMPIYHPEYQNYHDWYSAHHLDDRGMSRDDPDLVAVVEELGAEASGQCASLKVVEIPDDAEWEIVEYDGNEHIAEKHRTWG